MERGDGQQCPRPHLLFVLEVPTLKITITTQASNSPLLICCYHGLKILSIALSSKTTSRVLGQKTLESKETHRPSDADSSDLNSFTDSFFEGKAAMVNAIA